MVDTAKTLIEMGDAREFGAFEIQKGPEATHIPSHLHNIADVSGAGDTVIAVASLVYAATRDMRLMAEVANIAGDWFVRRWGRLPLGRCVAGRM